MAAWHYQNLVIDPVFKEPSEKLIKNIKNNNDLTNLKEVFLFYLEKDSEMARTHQAVFKEGMDVILWITFGTSIVLILNTIWITRRNKVKKDEKAL